MASKRLHPKYVSSKDNPFLPVEPIEGYRGYYPAPTTPGWSGCERIPLPLQCCTINDPDAVGFEVEIMFEAVSFDVEQPVFNHFWVKMTAAELFRHLFCATGIGIHDMFAILRRDDGTELKAASKWYQDTRTGAFQIRTYGCGIIATQGGYQGHMPENVYWDEKVNAWQLRMLQPRTSHWLV